MAYTRCILPANVRSPLDAAAELVSIPDVLCPAAPGTPACGPAGTAEGPTAPYVPAPELPPALPFEPVRISLAEQARLFYRSMGLRPGARFLAMRAAAKPVGEAGRAAA